VPGPCASRAWRPSPTAQGSRTGALLRLPGIGRRLAAQIVLDLKDKLGPASADAETAPTDGEVLPWLAAMGFPAAAQAAVAKLPCAPALSVEERVRHALTLRRRA
jgi:Holliday junction resolvasome RuvABC DNA-binding subunit